MKTAAASTDLADAREAARRLTMEITDGLGQQPQALMVFAAPSYDHQSLLDELAEQCPGAIVVGASSAGEFMNQERGEGLACAMGLAGEDYPDVDLLFTDVVLPCGMHGGKLADEVRQRRPGIRVLFTSGYTRNAIVHNGRLDPGVQLITKPFTYEELADNVRRVLEGGGVCGASDGNI